MEKLHVIALISGGKDSFFSILHCLKNGCDIVALGNLYPAHVDQGYKSQDIKAVDTDDGNENGNEDGEEQDDINSYMYQTVGHTIIPLYSQALNLPLYRQEILGSAINTSKEYSETGDDETESITLLLKNIMKEHPEANAVSTGAILSTYQRTRVESVAVRLGLTPLSFLWQYPVLPPYEQAALLRDMAAVGQDARIIKVASGGLDSNFLWENVADGKTIARLSRAMARFGDNGDGAVLGEGGEFETLAVDGPGVLWKGRIEVGEGSEVVVGEGGSAVWKGKAAKVVQKEEGGEGGLGGLRVPDLWDGEFKRIFEMVDIGSQKRSTSPRPSLNRHPCNPGSLQFPLGKLSSTPSTLTISNLAISQPSPSPSPSSQLLCILSTLKTHLTTHNLTPAHITHTTLLLRSISLFAPLNKIYSTFFTTPNPPSRVTVSCGDTLPEGIDVMLSVICSKELQGRKGLHVQSRSYWAPANIGPYSQGISVPLLVPLGRALPAASSSSQEDTDPSGTGRIIGEATYLAGQIPLVPATMTVHSQSFTEQAVLALQHLFRIGRCMRVQHWTTGVAFISECSPIVAVERVRIAQKVWAAAHHVSAPSTHGHSENGNEGDEEGDNAEDEEDDEDIDPWDLLNKPSFSSTMIDDTTYRSPIPDLSTVQGKYIPPPCIVVQVSSLPRDVDVEWSSVGISTQDHTATIRTTTSEDRAEHTTALSDSHFFQSRGLGRSGDEALQDQEAYEAGKGRMWEHGTVYAARVFGGGMVEGVEGLQWVPCWRVWGGDGMEVDGWVVGRGSVLGGKEGGSR